MDSNPEISPPRRQGAEFGRLTTETTEGTESKRVEEQLVFSLFSVPSVSSVLNLFMHF
jgi:hypothetical protein